MRLRLDFFSLITIVLTLFIAFLIGWTVTGLNYWFHEFGHVLFGGMGFSKYTTLNSFPIPVQTRVPSGNNNIFLAFAGPVFTLIWGFLIIYLLAKIDKSSTGVKKLVRNLFFGAVVIIYVSNAAYDVLFGTDNWHKDGTPILSDANYPNLKSGLLYLVKLLPLTLVFSISFSFYNKINAVVISIKHTCKFTKV